MTRNQKKSIKLKNTAIIDAVLTVGISEKSSKTSKERIILANVIFLAVPVVIIISYILDYKEYLRPLSEQNFDQFTRLMFAGASLVCYLLNRIHLFPISRWLYLLSWVAFWLVLDPVIQGTSSDYYFHFDLSIIGFSLISQILFSYRKSPISYVTVMLFSLICIFYQQSYLLYFDANRSAAELFLDNVYTYQTSIYYWAIFNLIIGYLLFIYEKSNTLLISNNKELDNLTSNLEELVHKRTADVRKKQHELIQSEEKYRKLFVNSYEGIVRLALDPPMDLSLKPEKQIEYLKKNLTVIECNHVFAEMHNQNQPEKLIGKHLSSIIDDQQSIIKMLTYVVSNDLQIDGKIIKESISGTDRWFISHITSQVEDNKVCWIWLNKLDITEKSVQDQERKVLLQNLEEYAFQTSHELRGPLSRLLGLTSLMLNKNLFKQEELPEMLKHINDTSVEIDDVIKMMNQVLTKSKYESKLTKSSDN